MASVLAGGVVVILGYASGIGINSTDAATAAPPAAQPPAATTPAVPAPTPPPAAHVPVVPGTSTMPDMAAPAHEPHAAAPEPTPAPTDPEPTPTEPADTCPAPVLEGLPAVGQLTSSLLSSVFSAPIVSDLAGPPVEGQATGPLSCLVGTVVGPTCCTTTATTAAKDAE